MSAQYELGQNDKYDGISASQDEKNVHLQDDDYMVKSADDADALSVGEEATAKNDLQIDQHELEQLEARMSAMTLDRAEKLARKLVRLHKYDQNFPRAALDEMSEFLNNPEVRANPEAHAQLIRQVKMECLLSVENSPYIEVRANVEATDDPTLPVFTVRVWIIGTIFSAAGSFIDTLFGYRNPPVSVSTNVGQLVAYPCGKFLAKVLPDWRFRLFGREHSLNPGPFNQKEHMLITIMCNVSFTAPYTNYIVPAQALPQFFGEEFARGRGYQFLNTIGTNFVGYGVAGLLRKFLVYPSMAIWPATLNTISLVKAFHTQTNEPVKGPFGRLYKASQERAFFYCFLAMFVYFFFPGFIFSGLSVFSWITWIAPYNGTLAAVTGFQSGVGLNPWPTFDWNNLTVWLVPLTIPTFAIMNMAVGILVGAVMSLGLYFSNGFNTGYLPINGNGVYDNMGLRYNVSRILNADNTFNAEQYELYSQTWMSAGYVTSYFWYFALYSATLTYVVMFNGPQVMEGARGLWRDVKRLFRMSVEDPDEDDLTEDIHTRLMKQNYAEVPEWQYMIVLAISVVIGMVGVGIYPTGTSPVVLVFGLIFSLLVIVPTGLIQAVTGIPVPLNVLAEFIGGSLVQGNADALMYFKTYGYISAYQAVYFCNDLKLAHYLKIPPRATFAAQLWATMIYCLVTSAIFNFALSFKDVCTPDAQFRFTCPNQKTFYSAAVFWGTVSPNRLFGPGRRYNLMLLGFPIGVIMVVIYWALIRAFPRSEKLRQVHPVMLVAGPSTWGAPYNMSYYIGNVYVTWLSFQFIRKRYLAFWVKYNYIVAAAFPCGIAVATLVIFFGLEIPKGGLGIDWWGNNIVATGCDGYEVSCTRLTELPEVGYFGAAPGTFGKG